MQYPPKLSFQMLSDEEIAQIDQKDNLSYAACSIHDCFCVAVGHVFLQPLCEEHYEPYRLWHENNMREISESWNNPENF